MALPLLSLPSCVPTGVENGNPPPSKRAVPPPRTQAEAWAALTKETVGDEYKEVIAKLYDALIREFQVLGTLDDRLGVPYPDGRMTQESFVPSEDLIRACELTTGTLEICNNNLLPLVLQKEDEHYSTTYGAGLAGDGMQLPENNQMIQMVLTMIKARDGIDIRLYEGEDLGPGKDPVAVRGQRMDRMYVPEMAANGAHLLSWRETVAYIVRARQWVPNFFPLVRNQNEFWPIFELVDAEGVATSTDFWWDGRPGREGPWNENADEDYDTPTKPNLTLEQAAAVLVHGQQAVILNDMREYFQTLPDDPDTRECIRLLGTCNTAKFMRKARYVQRHHGPVDAWDVSATQQLQSLQPQRLDPSMVTDSPSPHSVITQTFYSVKTAQDRVIDGLDNVLKGWPKNCFKMHHQNWKIGMWFVQNSWRQPHQLRDLSFAFMGNEHFNQYIGDWDVSNVTSLAATFQSARDFNQPLRDWDVSKVEDITRTFKHARAFDQGPRSLEGWGEKLTKVTRSTSATFLGAVTLLQRFGRPELRYGPPTWGWEPDAGATKPSEKPGSSKARTKLELASSSSDEEEDGEDE